jgi:transposase
VHHSDRGSQYVSIKYTERLAEAGVEPSVGSVGDSYDNALAETINGLYKAELIHRRARWRSFEAVEFATLPYSTDLRERAVEAVESGASRREIAEIFKVGVSSVIRWCQRWSETGSAAPKRSGGSVSPLEEHSDWILALIAKQPDLTLEEILAAMAKQGIPGSRSALQRFFDRHNVSFKKKPARGRAETSRCRSRPPTLGTRARHA